MLTVVMPLSQAADTVYTLTSTGSVNETSGTYTQTGTVSGHSVPDSTDAGNVLRFASGTATTLTLDQAVTLGGIKNDANATFAVAGPGILTLDGTGMSAGTQVFGNAGTAFLAQTSSGQPLTVSAPISIGTTALDIGNLAGVNTAINVSGAITATAAQTITLRGNGSGGVNLSGAIGASGGNISLVNAGTGTAGVIVSGALGSSVSSITQNSATSSLFLSGVNSHAGTTLNAGTLIGSNTAATNVLQAFGSSAINLNGGTLSLRANGTANNQTIVVGNNVVVGGSATIDTIRAAGGTFSTHALQLNNLTIGASTLTLTGANSYFTQFAGTTTLTGNATFNTSTANLTLSGAIGDGGNNFGITKTGSTTSSTTLTLAGASTYTGATTIANGVLAVNGASGALSNTSALSVTGGGTLQLGDATNGLANRLNTASALTLGGSTGSGTLQIMRGSTTANSQSLTALNVGVGSNMITTSGTTGGAPIVTFSGAAPYVRSTGGLINFNDANVTVAFTNAPSGVTNVNSGILIGAVKQGNDFVLAQAGNVTASSYAANTWASGNRTNVTASNDFSGTPTLTTGALRFNTAGAFTVTLAGVNTIQSGGILVGSTATSGTLTGGSIQTGLSGGDLWVYMNARPLTINSVISDNNTSGLTVGGINTNSILALTNTNTYAGPTRVVGGVLQIGNGGTTGDLGTGSSIFVGSGATLAYNRSNAFTTNGSVTGGGTVNSNNATGTLVLNQSGSGLFLKNIGGVSGATIEFGGDGTGVTSLGDSTSTAVNYMGVAGQNYRFSSGTVNLLDSGRGFTSNIEISGGTINMVNNPFSVSGVNGGTQTFTMTSGVLNAANGNGVSGFNGAGGAGQAGTANSTFVGNQSGGSIFVTSSTGRFDLGSTSLNTSTTYNFSGGLISHTNSTLGMKLGAETTGSSSTTFNFSGGKLIENFAIAGSQGAGAKQAFVWTGGTLATLLYDATNLTSSAGTAVVLNSTNTLTNGGGILAPGDIGTAGRTNITGNYNVTSANAAYAVDIGGTTAASAFQAGAGSYDQTAVSGTINLNGRLTVDLINGYTPPNDTTTVYRIINGNSSANSIITGTFTNLVSATGGNTRVVGADGLSSFLVAINNTASAATTGGLANTGARTVNLGGYKATNGYTGAGTAWDTAGAGAWANFDPGATVSPSTQASNAIARFADDTASTGSIAVSLNSTRNIQGIQFASASTGGDTRNYTITQGGSGAVILDNTNNGAAATITDSSAGGNTNAIDVPLTLNSNLAVSVTNAPTTLALGGVISGTGKSITKTGAGILALSGDNTYTGGTVVSTGTLLVNNTTGSGTGTGSLNVAFGATLGGSGTIGGITTIAGSLNPGNSPGIISFNNAVTFQSGSAINIEINGAATRGTDYDGVNFNGGLTVSGGTLTFNFGSTLADGAVLNLFDGTALTSSLTSVAASGSYSGSFTLNGEQTAYTAIFGEQTITFDLASGALSFTGSAVPEPASAALLAALGALGLAVTRRRRT